MRTYWCIGIGLAVLFLGLLGLLTAQQPAPPPGPAQAPAVFHPDTLAGEKNFVIGVQPPFTWFPDPRKWCCRKDTQRFSTVRT